MCKSKTSSCYFIFPRTWVSFKAVISLLLIIYARNSLDVARHYTTYICLWSPRYILEWGDSLSGILKHLRSRTSFIKYRRLASKNTRVTRAWYMQQIFWWQKNCLFSTGSFVKSLNAQFICWSCTFISIVDELSITKQDSRNLRFLATPNWPMLIFHYRSGTTDSRWRFRS